MKSRRPSRTLVEVARSLGATADLVPVLDELFAGVSALGSTPRRLVTLLREAGVGTGSVVLDVACGKGAVAVELAARLGCRVVGVDGCGAFLEAARRAAADRGVAGRCEWVEADVRSWGTRRRFDASLMIGLDGLAAGARVLRGFTRPGGVYVVDDAVRDGRHRRSAEFGGVPNAAEARAEVEALGDCVVRRVMLPRGAVASRGRVIVAAIEKTARRLGEERPGLRRSLARFVAGQRSAGRDLVGPLRPTIWVCGRGPRYTREIPEG